MPGNDAVDARQPDAGAFELALRVETLEGGEQLAGVGHVEARAVVLYEEFRVSVGLARSNFDASISLLAGEFPSVADEIFQDSLQQARVRAGGQAGRNHRLDPPVGILLP